jgi:hypothetical protein
MARKPEPCGPLSRTAAAHARHTALLAAEQAFVPKANMALSGLQARRVSVLESFVFHIS